MSTPRPADFWQFAAASEFLQLFITAFGIDFVGCDELEEGIITGNAFIIDLHIRLLRKYYLNRKSYLETIWMKVCGREFTKRLQPSEYPFEYKVGIEYSDLNIKERVLLLHFLCEVQFESKEFRERIDKFGVDQANWRVVPVGYDALGNAYWLFDDCRLYCESPIADPDSYYHYEPLELDDNGSYIMNEPAPEMDIIDNSHSLSKDSSDTKDSATTDPRDESHAIKKITGLDSLDELPSSCATVTNSPPHKSTGFKIKLKNLKKSSIPQSWSLVCSNKEEWENFPNRFKDSTNSKERKFYKYLTRNLIPLILRDLKSFEGLIIERDRKIMELEEAKRDRVLQQQQYEEELANLKLAREREKELAEEAKKKPKIEAPPKRTSSRIKEKVVYVNSDIRVESGDGDYAGSRLISRRSTGAYQTRLSLNL